jgi:hypothetical protein
MTKKSVGARAWHIHRYGRTALYSIGARTVCSEYSTTVNCNQQQRLEIDDHDAPSAFFERLRPKKSLRNIE